MSKPNRLILAPTDGTIEGLLLNGRATLLFQTNCVCILESIDESVVDELQRGSPRWTKIFEEYYLARASDDTANGIVVSAFFDWLADRYNDEIDQSRNVACYEELYRIAQGFRTDGDAPAVLDVGCGPGTIMRTHVANSARKIVGYDISELASRIAVSTGMTVMTRDQFLCKDPRFEVALSAYSMHYACDLSETLDGVQNNLKSQGIWALNFHKGIGLEVFLSYLSTTSLELVALTHESNFGPLVIVRKR